MHITTFEIGTEQDEHCFLTISAATRYPLSIRTEHRKACGFDGVENYYLDFQHVRGILVEA